MSWNTQFSIASKGDIQEMKKVTITSQFRTVSVCFLCLLLTVVPFSVTSIAAKTKKVLILGNNVTQVETATISKKVKKVQNFTFDYEITKDKKLAKADASDFDILWLGQGEICEGGWQFTDQGSDAVLEFVEEGGVCIVVEQDHDDAVGCPTPWLPKPLNGDETGGAENFELTKAPEIRTLFTKPNKIERIVTNDRWHNPDKAFITLATVGKHLIAALLYHGKGAYIITAMQNESQAQLDTNLPFIENLLFYTATLQDEILAVEPHHKLAVTWAQLKMNP
ncbi:hypothetical protein C6500_21105 [Candidatus Poribacteria bacterium]|nr:MAG: hypothetical protein C6500_21105 [Candidatus Poribacteria bacterium]